MIGKLLGATALSLLLTASAQAACPYKNEVPLQSLTADFFGIHAYFLALR